MNKISPESLQSLTRRVNKTDLDIVVSTYYETPEAEEKRVREIFRENIGFWKNFRETVEETDPENVRAMMRGAVLLIGTLSRREEIDQLKQILQESGENISTDLEKKAA